MAHLDEIYSFQNILDDSKGEISSTQNATLRLMGQLSAKVSGPSKVFFENLRELLCDRNFFKEINRISFVTRLGLSNQLYSRHTWTNTSEEDLMAVGYSCFVRENGSLLSMFPGRLRLYKNSETVVQKFKKESKKPQRSILRISQMKLKSGICFPIYGDFDQSIGFLFLNSKSDIFPKHLNNANKTLLYYAANALKRYCFEYFNLDKEYFISALKNKDLYMGKHYNHSDFIETATNHGLKIICDSTLSGFLLSYGNIIYLLKKYSIPNSSINMRIDSQHKIEFKFDVHQNILKDTSLDEFDALGWKTIVNDKFFRISQKTDETNSEELYSIDMQSTPYEQ